MSLDSGAQVILPLALAALGVCALLCSAHGG